MAICQIYLPFIVEFRHNKIRKMAERIGFITSNIYQGTSIAMWKALSEVFRSVSDCSLFILPGGRLNAADDSENMRSMIYDLACRGSLDGIIIWASSLSGFARKSDITRFVREIAADIPAVVVGMDVEGIPSVTFDDYSGMRALVSHFIEVHGERRIAFLRGPRNHEGAEERYRAYCDALSIHGISFDERLVSEPHGWNDGVGAIRDLTDSRALVPGRDFTAIIAASDLLLTSAVLHLEKQGITVPDDLRAGGFNDTDDNLRLSTGLTTVRLPVARIISSAYSMLRALMEGRPAESQCIRTELVVRNSCGCVSDRMAGEHVNPYEGVQRILSSCGSRSDLHESISAFIAASGDTDVLVDAVMKRPDALMLGHEITREYRRTEAELRSRVRNEGRILDVFKTGLLAARSYEAIPPIMQRSFPDIGIRNCFLVLHKEGRSVMRAGFSGGMLYSTPCSFPGSMMLPESVSSRLEQGVYIVEPLFYGSSELGHLVFSMESNVSYIAENLRSSFSAAVRGIELFEEATRMRKEAERSENDAQMFYSKLSQGVLQPISEMRGLLLSEDIDREKLSMKLSEAEHILRLALMERAGYSPEKRLIPFGHMVPVLESIGFRLDLPQDLPSFEIDKKAFAEMMHLIKAWGDRGNGYLDDRGLRLSISIGEEGEGSPSLILAERIAFFSSYGFTIEGGRLVISIPYPRLSDGSSPEGRSGILFLRGDSTDDIPDAIASLASLDNPHPRTIAWRYGDVPSSLIEGYKDSYMACFSLGKEAVSLEAVLFPDNLVLVYGDIELPASIAGRTIRIRSREESLKAGAVSAIILCGVDVQDALWFRAEVAFASVPIIYIKDRFQMEEAEVLSSAPSMLMLNPSVFASSDAVKRLSGIINGDDMLPAFTASSVRRAIAYMNGKSGSVISRWQVAEAAGVNEDYLTRIFHREIGVSPWEYLSLYRVHAAKELLISTALPVRDIAAETGFQDPAYFSRVFRKAAGMSPGDFRKLHVQDPRRAFKHEICLTDEA